MLTVQDNQKTHVGCYFKCRNWRTSEGHMQSCAL